MEHGGHPGIGKRLRCLLKQAELVQAVGLVGDVFDVGEVRADTGDGGLTLAQ